MGECRFDTMGERPPGIEGGPDPDHPSRTFPDEEPGDAPGIRARALSFEVHFSEAFKLRWRTMLNTASPPAPHLITGRPTAPARWVGHRAAIETWTP